MRDLNNHQRLTRLEQIKDPLFERSEMVKEIVSSDPGFLVRWGNLFFVLILSLIGLACRFIKYPNSIMASAKLTSINAPKPVTSQRGGKLLQLHVAEDEKVTAGQILGNIESIANYDEVMKLSSNIETIQVLIEENNLKSLGQYFKNEYKQLGELQPAYQVFLQAFLSFRNYYADGFYIKKSGMLKKDLENLKQLHRHLISQKALQKQDLAITQKTFDVNESLKQNQVISDLDYRREQSKLINKKLAIPQVDASILMNASQQNEKTKEIMELENVIDQQKLLFQQAINTFQSQVEDWKKQYTLIAPVSGKVAFASFIQENQQVQSNQIICYIHPENSQYFAEIVIPQSNLGKAAPGQKVLLKFPSYPFHEYGSVRGKIEFISSIPGDQGYLARVSLTNGLSTTYRKKIHYRDELLANAEIITADMRLLERFYYNFMQHMHK